jgi:hypothetical protein
VAVGERLRDRFGAGTVFVPPDTITDPGLALAAVGRMAGADLARTGSPLEALAETFGDGAWLLILDNLEQVLTLAPDLGELLARCPTVAILATSRTVLGLRRRRWTATMTPRATCARRATWRSSSVVTGSPRDARRSWASWRSSAAGSIKPGRCSIRRWI